MLLIVLNVKKSTMCLISSIVLTSKGGGEEGEKHKHSVPAQGHLHTLLSVSWNKEKSITQNITMSFV